MGIFRAAETAAESLMEDQWCELYECDALPGNTILVRAGKRTNPRSANAGTPEHVISKGSKIIVNEGQAAMVVEDGKVIALYDQPGSYQFDGGYGVRGLWQEFGKRVAFGGDNVATQQHVYYLSTRELTGQPFIVCAPVTTGSGGEQLTTFQEIRGSYSIRILDPTRFYRTLTSNVREVYTYRMLRTTMESELREALLHIFARLSAGGIDITQIAAHVPQLQAAVDEALSQGWAGDHGIGIAALAISSITPGKREWQRVQQREDRGWTAGKPAQRIPPSPAAPANPEPAIVQNWRCTCGTIGKGKFCEQCGQPRPACWICECGTANFGKFCEQCGAPRAGR